MNKHFQFLWDTSPPTVGNCTTCPEVVTLHVPVCITSGVSLSECYTYVMWLSCVLFVASEPI